MMKRKNYQTCDAFGCIGVAEVRVISYLHPVTNEPVWRNYCFIHNPLHCSNCMSSIGIVLIDKDKRYKRNYYKCQWCRETFSNDWSD